MPEKKTPTDPRFKDFDAAVDEEKPIPIRLLGKDWKLPGSVPAETIMRVQSLMLLAQKLEEEGEDALPDDFVITEDLSVESMARKLVGDDNVDAWLRLGITYTKLTEVTQYVFSLHTGGEEPGKAPKQPADRKRKATAPRKAAASPRKRS